MAQVTGSGYGQKEMGGPMRRVALVLSAFILIFAAEKAEACGGLFCGNTPVDQTAERILFEVNNDNTTSAVIEIPATAVTIFSRRLIRNASGTLT